MAKTKQLHIIMTPAGAGEGVIRWEARCLEIGMWCMLQFRDHWDALLFRDLYNEKCIYGVPDAVISFGKIENIYDVFSEVNTSNILVSLASINGMVGIAQYEDITVEEFLNVYTKDSSVNIQTFITLG